MADGRARGPGVFARWLPAALLAAAGLFAAEPAAADDTGDDTHLHFRVVLSSNTATEGQTGKITVNVECVADSHALCNFPFPGNNNRTGADFTITATNPSGSNNGVTQAGTTVGYTIPAFVPGTPYIHSFGTTDTGSVQLTLQDNSTQDGTRQVTVSASAACTLGTWWREHAARDFCPRMASATLVILDDETPPGIVLNKTTLGLTEQGSHGTYTVRLSQPPTGNVQVRVARNGSAIEIRNPGIPSLGIAESWTSFRLLTFTANNWNTPQTVQVRAPHDANAADAATGITHSIVQANTVADFDNAPNKALTVNVTDDETAAVVLSRSTPLAMTEGEEATYSVRLSHVPTAPVRVVNRSHGLASLRVSWQTGGPYHSGVTYTYTKDNWNTAKTVYVKGWEDANSANESVTMRHTVYTGYGWRGREYDDAQPKTLTVNVADNDGLKVDPRAVTVHEEGSGAGYTVALVAQPAQAVTVSVAAPASLAASPDTLTFDATTWSTAQTVTLTARGDTDAVDDTVTVRHSTASGDARFTLAAQPSFDVTVTVDDDDAPALGIDAPSVAEGTGTGGTLTFTVGLSQASTGEVTVDYADAGTGTATAGADYVAIAPGTLTFAAGDVRGTFDVAVAGDSVDERNETVVVTLRSPTNANVPDGAGTGTGTITDDDPAPGVTLALDPASIAENGGTSAVSATLSHPSSEPSTVTVQAASGFFTVTSPGALTIAAGATTTTGTVTLTATDNAVHSGNRTAGVTATLANGAGTGSVTPATLTLTEDEASPVAALALDPASISENGGVASVTATLSGASTQAVVLTVAAAPGLFAAAADFGLSATTTLTIAAGQTASTGAVTVTANDNQATTGSKQVTVSATAAGGNGVAAPANAILTLTDDDTPETTLRLSSSSIAEAGGVATVTATLDRTSSVAVTVTVAAAPGSGTDFTLSAANTLTFAANATASAGTVTVTAVDDDTDAPNKGVTVSGTSSDSLGRTNDPPSVPLAITDDDAAPGVVLALSDPSISESGGTSTVSATLSHPSSAATTVRVTAVAGAFTVPPGAAGWVVIAAGATTAAADTVTITAVDNATDEPDRPVTVTATVANGQGAGSVTGVTLTLEDDDAAPTAALSVSPASISENGATATVRATLSHPSSQPTTVTVTAQANVFTVASGAGGTIIVAAGQTTTTDTATITAVDNDADAADNPVTVAGVMANSQGAGSVDQSPGSAAGASLTLTDDDTTGLSVSPTTSTASRLRTTEAGGTDTFTVTLATVPTGNVVLDVASSDTDEGTVDTSALTFTASTWDTAQTVTLTGVDDPDTDGSQNYTVTLVVDQADTADANYDTLGTVSVYAFNADDEVTADVNEDGRVDRDDALVLFYVYSFGADLKDSASLRDAALRPRKGALAENDASYLQMITNAESWATAAPTGSDLNADGRVDRDDALVMFYVYSFGADLKDSASLRDAALRPRKGALAENDASYLQMITNAERLAGITP